MHSYRHSLTPRERSVLALVGKGHSDKEIARILGLATSTVSNCVATILTKLDAANRTEAAMKAVAAGLTPVTREEPPE